MHLPTYRIEYILYAKTIFVSSFLLFQVQPLLGKHILPWFGGSPAVWIAAMFFFMVVLALGYVYALALSCLSRQFALMVHASVVVLVGNVLYKHAVLWQSAITPLLEQVPTVDNAAPMVAVCSILSLAIGLPFFLLSTTSSLLQHWYGQTTAREPFSLYAFSNAGSLIGLLSYPFLFEPFLSTYQQGWWWSIGFALYVMLLLTVLAVVAWRGVVTPVATAPVIDRVSKRTLLIWTLLASVPVATMLTGTSYISGYVAPIPFLWVIPLGLYLVSFVVSFRGGAHTPDFFTHAFTLVFGTMTLIALLSNAVSMPIVLLLVFATMFSIFHLCHERLYELRPPTVHLTTFYVALSLGGILGSTLVLVSSLYVLPMPLEFPGIVAVSVLIAARLLFTSREFSSIKLAVNPRILLYAVTLVVVSSFGIELYNKTNKLTDYDRNFFGYKAVYDREYKDFGQRRTLIHGTTNHGYQFFEGEVATKPVAYYSETSGIARSFAGIREGRTEPLRVAVVGLGSGALAAHCAEGDDFDYFEIDPEVISLAKEHFTYLEQCKGSSVHLGDARLLLKEQFDRGERGVYDLIILDAYADDMMPIHLMTADAVAMYKELLADDGILATHISSRYLVLGGVVYGNAERNGMTGRYHFDRDQPAYATPSNWTMMAKDDAVFDKQALREMPKLSDFTPVYWTDTYSSIASVVRWW